MHWCKPHLVQRVRGEGGAKSTPVGEDSGACRCACDPMLVVVKPLVLGDAERHKLLSPPTNVRVCWHECHPGLCHTL